MAQLTLEERITRLEDIEAIKQLKARYCDICDDMHNPNRIGALFAEDGIWESPDFGQAKGHAAIRQLFVEYSDSLEIELDYQGFPAELAGLPGAYAPPRGCLLLATDGRASAGCVALRPFDSITCEMKRLFVRPERQGTGLGRILATRVIMEARTIGYATILLDTLPTMRGALHLYEKLGFTRRSAYYATPIEGSVFMELQLR